MNFEMTPHRYDSTTPYVVIEMYRDFYLLQNIQFIIS